MSFPHASAARRRRRPLTLLSASLASLLLATACGTGGSGDGASSSAAPSSSSDAGSASPASSSGAESSAPQDTTPATVGDGVGEPDALKTLGLQVADDGTPTVTLDKAVQTDTMTTRVVATGDGERVTPGSTVKLNAVAADPVTGDVQAETFSQKQAQSIPVDDQLKSTNPEMYDLLSRVNVGGVVAQYFPPQELPAPSPSASDASASSASPSHAPAQLFLYRVESILPTHAEGTAVAPKDDRLPKVTEDATTHEPTVEKPSGEAPDQLVVEPLVQGDGATVGKDDTVTVQYTGVKWSDGSVFDSSWERGTPATFPLDGVIKGWTDGLAGQKVGSRVLLSVPADQAYGEKGSAPKIGPNEDLLFVVDILDTAAPAASSSAPSGSAAPSSSASSAAPSPSASN